jgi:hypothetical protein
MGENIGAVLHSSGDKPIANAGVPGPRSRHRLVRRSFGIIAASPEKSAARVPARKHLCAALTTFPLAGLISAIRDGHFWRRGQVAAGDLGIGENSMMYIRSCCFDAFISVQFLGLHGTRVPLPPGETGGDNHDLTAEIT